MLHTFEQVGWNRVDITAQAQRRVEEALRAAGAEIDSIDVSSIVTGYKAFRHLSEYDSQYKAYAGPLEHCLLEKCLEHFLSLALVSPKPGTIAVDVGSCQSILPSLGRRVYGIQYFEQDLQYPPGLHGNRIGSNADAIPLPAESVDLMTLHCAFEHFEHNTDTRFVKECGRLLKKGGATVILPLYMCEAFCNVTGETNSDLRGGIGFDAEADHYCLIPEWQNRFGRHYSPDAFMRRIWHPAIESGLRPRMYRVDNWAAIHPDLWIRWALVLERPVS